jgi:hypothetical protein
MTVDRTLEWQFLVTPFSHVPLEILLHITAGTHTTLWETLPYKIDQNPVGNEHGFLT